MSTMPKKEKFTATPGQVSAVLTDALINSTSLIMQNKFQNRTTIGLNPKIVNDATLVNLRSRLSTLALDYLADKYGDEALKQGGVNVDDSTKAVAEILKNHGIGDESASQLIRDFLGKLDKAVEKNYSVSKAVV